MTEQEFKRLMTRVRYLGGDYAAGYQRGLRRLYHGTRFGTPEEHELWIRLGLDGDHRTELGRGYRDGFTGIDPTPKEGRPELPPDEKTKPRTVRLNDARWEKLRALGTDWLEQRIDEA